MFMFMNEHTFKYWQLVDFLVQFALQIQGIVHFVEKILRWNPAFLFRQVFLYEPPIWIRVVLEKIQRMIDVNPLILMYA